MDIKIRLCFACKEPKNFGTVKKKSRWMIHAQKHVLVVYKRWESK